MSQGAFAAAFVDYILHLNADNFSNQKGHLLEGEMMSKLDNFCTTNRDRVQSVYDVSYQAQLKQNQNKSNSANSAKSSQKGSKPKSENKLKRRKLNAGEIPIVKITGAGETFIDMDWICTEYQTGSCKLTVAEGTNYCHDAASDAYRLHVCRQKMKSGYPCGMDHGSKDHKK